MNIMELIQYFMDENKEVNIFLRSGIKLDGIIGSMNPTGITLTRDGRTQAIFMDAIATVSPR